MENKENANQFPLPPQSDDKDKALPSQALEYYKKYSQNRQLPKYFCGTSFKIEDWHGIPSKSDTVSVNEQTIKPSETDCNNWTRPPLIGQDHLSEQIKIPDINVVSADVLGTSPTSSVASNRKLEWDNGADIGYSNVETHKILHKSISLPVLTNLDYGELRKNLLRLSPEGNIEIPQGQPLKQSKTDQIQSPVSFNPPYSSSTTESVKSSNKNYVSSSSSSLGPQQKEYFSDSDSSNDVQNPSGVLKFLKEKVGFPLAESTPIIRTNEEYTPKSIKPKKGKKELSAEEDIRIVSKGTSSLGEKFSISNSCENLSLPKTEGLKKWHSQIDLNMVDQVSHYKNLKVLKLCISKPVVVECFGISNRLGGENKFIQTSLPRNISIAVQTDFDFTQNLPTQSKKDLPKERQSVLYLCHSDSDKEKNTNSSGTQTNSGALSNCNSFEYLYGADYDKNLKTPVVINQDPGPSLIYNKLDTGVDQGNLKRCPPKSDLTTLTPDSDKTEMIDSSTTSKESPLAELISTKPSDHLIDDLHKNLQLLQKVIKSKKYDSITKKYCLKKIVQKLVDSKYSDDSSESFDTSEKSEVKKYMKEGMYQETGEVQDLKNGNTPVEKFSLLDNKPWIPIQQTSGIPQRGVKNLQTQTFTNEILPKEQSFVPYQDQKTNNFVPIQIIHDTKTRLERNPLFTLTDHGLDTENQIKIKDHSSNSTENELYEVLQRSPPLMSSTDSSSLREKNGKKVQSWREDKTRSEQLLEQKSGMGDSGMEENKDHLINFAKKEREHQLSWINNEITHLGKLKKLLEKRESPKSIQQKVLQSIIEKPRIEDMKGTKKSTTVYIVTTEKNSGSPHSLCDPKTCKNPCCRERFINPTPSSSNYKSSTPKPKIICKCEVPPCCCKPENLKVYGTIANVGTETIDLKNARLVSSEQFTTGSNDNCKTSIRRYTFEIPLENDIEAVEVEQPKVIECPPKKSSPKCDSRSSSPKQNRLECELVVRDEIISEEPKRCSCTSRTSCKCSENKKTQTSDSLLDVKSCMCSSSSCTCESDCISEASTPQLCRCCKKQCEKMRRARLEANCKKSTFCYPCYNQNKINPYCMYPGYVCRCYNMVQAETVHKIKKTIEALEDLEEEEEFCKCICAKAKSGFCANCNCKLKKPKGGMAYVLTLDSDSDKKCKRKTDSVVGEIKIKVQSPTNKQRNNCNEDCREESTKDSSTNESECCPKKNKRKKKKCKVPTLQEYLHQNNPNFVCAAEERRKCLLELGYMREKRCQKYKQLLALTNGIPFKNNTAPNTKSQHVFSSKEMKQLTAKHYKKLPEVQQKLIDNKEKQIKKANKLLANIFNQNLRQQVLKGKHTIPPDASIINLV